MKKVISFKGCEQATLARYPKKNRTVRNSADCIREGSQARVLTHGPQFVTQWDMTRTPPAPMSVSRKLTAADAREMVVRRYS